VLDGHLSELGSRSRHRRCEPPPISTLNGHPHSFPAGPTPSAATLCMSGGPCSILEVRLSRETHGWSHQFQPWQGSPTGTFFEKSIRWSKLSGKSTFGTGTSFVDTFNCWSRTPGCHRTLLELLEEEAGRSQVSAPDKPLHHHPEASHASGETNGRRCT
jgi:hypothetical protein